MIYTFKVHASEADQAPLETTHCAHGADVLAHAKALLRKHPGCGGVEVLMLGARLFFMPSAAPPAGPLPGAEAGPGAGPGQAPSGGASG